MTIITLGDIIDVVIDSTDFKNNPSLSPSSADTLPTASPVAGESVPAPPSAAEVPVNFEEAPSFPLCSKNVCSRGHEWLPHISLAKCPGCGAPIVAVKMVQCPICNEPVAKLQLRSEHLPQGGSITALCAGSATLNEVIVMEIERQHSSQEQSSYKDREVISKI